jgi:hypothetical protein
MATKNNPGPYDCIAAAHPDEPYFALLGRDPHAPTLVCLWVLMRIEAGEDPAKCANATVVASQMEEWAIKLGKTEKMKASLELLRAAIRKLDPEHFGPKQPPLAGPVAGTI